MELPQRMLCETTTTNKPGKHFQGERKMKIKTEIIQTFKKFEDNGGFAMVIARQENTNTDFPEMEISWLISHLPDEIAIVWLNKIEKELFERLEARKK